MTDRFRGGLLIAVILVAVLALEAFGLTSGTGGITTFAVFAGLGSLLLVLRANLAQCGVYAACAASFTLTWNGWFIGPVRPGDVLVLLALVCLVSANPNGGLRTPPWWIKQLGVVVVVVAAVHVAFPAGPVYLSHRVVLSAVGQPIASTTGSLAAANIGIGLKFLVAIVAIPMAFVGAARVDRRAARWLAISFAGGTALSGTAAFLDHIHLTDLGVVLTGLPNVVDRQVGFADHPNFLAAGLVLATPFAFWLLVARDRRLSDLLLGAAFLPGLVMGTYASGSRGGAVCVVATIAVCVLLFPRTRQYALGYVLAAGFVVGMVVTFVPSLGPQILRVTRLSGGIATAGSDLVRAAVGAQGVRDFYHSPIQGIGLQVSTEASEVYLQQLAAGGLLLFGAVSVYMLSGLVAAFKVMARHDLAAAIAGALLATLGLNIFEADLTDRFYYVPAAILVALIETTRRGDGVAAPAAELDRASAD